MKWRRASFSEDGQRFVVVERYWHLGILLVLLAFPTIYNPQHPYYSFGRISCGIVLGVLGIAAFIAFKQTSFDKAQGVFIQETRLFRKKRVEGSLRDIRHVQITSWFRPGNPRNDHLMWNRSRESICANHKDALLEVLSMTGPDNRMAGGIPPDEIATKLATLIGCKMVKVAGN